MLAGAIGTGLTFSAATNTCAMGKALSAMPWNKAAKEHTREAPSCSSPSRAAEADARRHDSCPCSWGSSSGLSWGWSAAGGSIIAVPALVYGVGMSPAQAIPTSLLVVGASSLAALLPRIREGLNWPVIALVGAAGIPAAGPAPPSAGCLTRTS